MAQPNWAYGHQVYAKIVDRGFEMDVTQTLEDVDYELQLLESVSTRVSTPNYTKSPESDKKSITPTGLEKQTDNQRKEHEQQERVHKYQSQISYQGNMYKNLFAHNGLHLIASNIIRTRGNDCTINEHGLGKNIDRVQNTPTNRAEVENEFDNIILLHKWLTFESKHLSEAQDSNKRPVSGSN
ncbi:hypothetical protein C2S51_000300 [Perilla frutescens var. frutescens]|nr:hypothetical protein C2S51_000300 [Perilla frutescens var. frutescens]